jgi:hypothetical protein
MPDRNFTFHPYSAPTAAKVLSDDTIESTGAGSKERIELLVQITPAVFDGSLPAGGRRIFRCITQADYTRNIQLIPLFVCQHTSLRIEREEVLVMNGIIYLVGLIVVIMAILSFLGLR